MGPRHCRATRQLPSERQIDGGSHGDEDFGRDSDSDSDSHKEGMHLTSDMPQGEEMPEEVFVCVSSSCCRTGNGGATRTATPADAGRRPAEHPETH